MQPKIKLAAIAKNEGAYIPQWVFHHLNSGFDCLEFWINGTTDNSRKILRKLSEQYPGQILIQEADDLLLECKIKEKNFQIEAYSQIFAETKRAGEFSHVFFLDLDEFWISLTPNSSIKDVVAGIPDAESIAFQWYIDIPDYSREAFSSIIRPELLVQKDRHVKSLIKITDKDTKVLIHNSKIFDGNFYLGNGDPLEETHPEQEHRQKVSNEYFAATKNIIDNCFILHLVYKSQTEYLASLMRGRVHVNDNNVFKVNRFGYNPYTDPDQFYVRFGMERATAYRDAFLCFMQSTDLMTDVQEAQRFVYAKCNQALDVLAETPSLLTTYHQQLRGLQIDELQNSQIRSTSPLFHIDVIKLFGSTLIVLGWAWDPLSVNKIELEVDAPEGSVVSISKAERPDVQSVHSDAHLDCGFKIEINLTTAIREKLDLDSLPFKVFAKNPYFRHELTTGKKIILVE